MKKPVSISRCTASAPISELPRAFVRHIAALVTVLAAGACASLGAPGAAVPDRPGYTDTPTALPARAVELEAGWTDDRTAAAPGIAGTAYVTVGEALLRVGVGARTELRVFGNSFATSRTDGTPTVRGMEDVKLGAKINLRAVPDGVHSLLPSAALLVAATLPTGASGISAGSAQPEVKLAVSWTTPSPFSVYANAGLGSFETASGRVTRQWTSVAGWWAVSPKVSVYGEGLSIGRVSGNGGGASSNDIDAGATYLLNDRFQIDVRVGRGVGSALSRERFIGAGFARRW